MTPTHREALRDSVRSVLDDFQRLSAEARFDSLGALYSDSESFRFYESGALQYASAAAVREALEEFPAGASLLTEFTDVHVEPLAPGVALTTAGFTTTLVTQTAEPFSFSGVVSLVWIHEEGGWRIVSGHSSSPVPRGSP